LVAAERQQRAALGQGMGVGGRPAVFIQQRIWRQGLVLVPRHHHLAGRHGGGGEVQQKRRVLLCREPQGDGVGAQRAGAAAERRTRATQRAVGDQQRHALRRRSRGI